MNKKTLITLIIFLVLFVSICGCLEKENNQKPIFKISNINISPKEFQTGEKATLTAKITNIGKKAKNYTLKAYIDNESLGSKSLYLLGGESLEIKFNVTREKEGNYSIKIGNKTTKISITSLTLEKVKDLNLTEKPGYIYLSWSSVEKAYEYNIYRTTNRKEELLTTTNSSYFVDQKCSSQKNYSYRVSALRNEVEGEKSVSKEASTISDVKIKNLTISSEKIVVGESINVSATIVNEKETKIEHSTWLLINDEIEAIKKVSLSPYEEEVIYFEIQKEALKNYSIRIGNLTESFEVISPPSGDLNVLDLNISPSFLSVPPPGLPGYKEASNITVSVLVRNNENYMITGTLEVYLNEDIIKEDKITLQSNEEREITYEFKIKKEGNHIIRVDDLTRELRIVSRM